MRQWEYKQSLKNLETLTQFPHKLRQNTQWQTILEPDSEIKPTDMNMQLHSKAYRLMKGEKKSKA